MYLAQVGAYRGSRLSLRRRKLHPVGSVHDGRSSSRPTCASGYKGITIHFLIRGSCHSTLDKYIYTERYRNVSGDTGQVLLRVLPVSYIEPGQGSRDCKHSQIKDYTYEVNKFLRPITVSL